MLRFVFLSLVVLLLSSCEKDTGCNFRPCDVVAPDNEIQAVESYLASQGITNATNHCSGLYYLIDTAGTGSVPDGCSSITVDHSGKLVNGTEFSKGPFSIEMDKLIRGWRIGLPLIKEGGTVTMYIPPTLGYGNVQNGPIPPGSILIFRVNLKDVY